MVEEFAPDLGAIDEAFMVLRSQDFVVDRELQMQAHRELIKPDIIWNTEKGLAQSPSRMPGPSANGRRFPPVRGDVRAIRHLRHAKRGDPGVRCEAAAPE